jgi:hypothetical protein
MRPGDAGKHALLHKKIVNRYAENSGIFLVISAVYRYITCGTLTSEAMTEVQVAATASGIS